MGEREVRVEQQRSLAHDAIVAHVRHVAPEAPLGEQPPEPAHERGLCLARDDRAAQQQQVAAGECRAQAVYVGSGPGGLHAVVSRQRGVDDLGTDRSGQLAEHHGADSGASTIRGGRILIGAP